MIVEKIKSPGLAHLSYFLASESAAAVIDPRRDVEVYEQLARENGVRITHILETHRNEDLLSGAPILSERTGARVFHGPNADGSVSYALITREGDRHEVGDASIEVLETPGHTDDSLSYVLYDTDYDNGPVGVFTGDALFVGDVGRTDFYPDRAREVAGLLFDSLQKLLALGDGVIIYPAHGAGSVCGSGMADREFSTVGHERRNNPRLAITSRDAFIDYKVAEHHYQPPYFRLMERLNLEGASAVRTAIPPPKLGLDALDELDELDAPRLVDVRSIHAFAGAHLPGSLAIPVDMIPAFAGWLVEPDADIVLVAASDGDAKTALEHLTRIGFDHVRGYIEGPMSAAAAAKEFGRLPFVDADTVERRLSGDEDDWVLLDVRAIDEYRDGHIDGAKHAYVGKLPDAIADLDPRKRYTVLCGSGARATVGASVLAANGFGDVDVFLGSMKAWRASGRPVVEASAEDAGDSMRRAGADPAVDSLRA